MPDETKVHILLDGKPLPTPETEKETPVSSKSVQEEDAPVVDPEKPAPDFSQLQIGDRGHFVLQDGFAEGQCRPFDVTKILDREHGIVNGRVATDMSDFAGAGQDGLFIENCVFSDEHTKGTWHNLHV